MARILVVDDEFTIAESISELLSWEGYDVRTAPNGKIALERLLQGGADLVLLDYMMPIVDGYKLLTQLRARPEFKELPVVMVTAVPERQLPTPKLWDAYLPKPFELDDLLDITARLLKQK